MEAGMELDEFNSPPDLIEAIASEISGYSAYFEPENSFAERLIEMVFEHILRNPNLYRLTFAESGDSA